MIVELFFIIAVILEELIQFIDIFDASKESRGPLMDFGGLDIKNSPSSCRSCTTRLFHDHRHWCTFIKEPQLSIWRASSDRITVNPSIDKNIVYISDKGSDITSIRSVTAKERNIEAFGAANNTPYHNRLFLPDPHRTRPFFQCCEIPLHRLLKVSVISLVEAVNGACRWDSHVFMSVQKLAGVWIQGEAIYPRSKSEHQNGSCTMKRVEQKLRRCCR